MKLSPDIKCGEANYHHLSGVGSGIVDQTTPTEALDISSWEWSGPRD